jgi:RNA polymerase sigma-70 factor (ECF subfamily)
MTNPSRPFVSSSGVPRTPANQQAATLADLDGTGLDDNLRDRELFSALADGGRDGLADLYDRHAASLFRHAMALSRRQADAEDLVQATFLKLTTTGADLANVTSPSSYLHRMLHLTWLDGRRREVVGERAVEQIAGGLEWVVPAMDDSIDIARAMDDLAVAQREAIVLHLTEGLSFREIGRATGVSLFTAAARYRLGITRLRRRLERAGRGRV